MAGEKVRRAWRRYDGLPTKAHIVIVIIALMMIVAPLISAAGSGGTVAVSDSLGQEGFYGVSERTVVPAAKATLVAFDPDDLVDDFSYLAAVPASTYYVESEGVSVSSPLMFYRAPMDSPSIEETALDDGVGIEYLMDDHVTASGGKLSSITTVDIPRAEAEVLQAKWAADDLVAIKGNGVAGTAASIATSNWEWARTAVVAVVDPSIAPVDQTVSGNLSGTVPSVASTGGQFTGSIGPSFHAESSHSFDVGDQYKYVQAVMEWNIPGPFPGLTQRGKELGLHLYSGDIMVALSTEWNAFQGAVDTAQSFVYTPGPWRAAVVFIPTMGLNDPAFAPPAFESPSYAQRVFEEARYTITYDLYGGVDVPMEDIPAPGARNAVFTLTWGGGRELGLLIRGPSGQEIASAIGGASPGMHELLVPELGSGAYTVSVVNLDGQAGEIDFDLEYSWEEPMSEMEVDSLVGATEAAVLASELNAPLLYATPDGVPSATLGALDVLGTTDVHLVDLTGHVDKVRASLRGNRGAGQPSIDVEVHADLASLIAKITKLGHRGSDGRQDVVITTLNPWDYWYTDSNDENPQGEEWGGRYFAPAAYAAANHGCPVLVTESDPRLSSSNAYHNNYWLRAYRGRSPAPVGAMYLTGQQVMDAIASYGLDGEGMESLVTVAGQFEIGTAWDRSLVGATTPGRIGGTPVDASVWISRCSLYPLEIFANPAVDPSIDPHDGKRIVGSRSTRTAGVLRIVEPEREVQMDDPVAFTWACYLYKFNERAAEYWGAEYQAADGTIPNVSPSEHPWDDGTLPDICEDVFEDYSRKSGYGEAESAGYDASIENMNRGVIMWIETMHGSNGGSGFLGWWSSDKNQEANPHRAYEEYPQNLMGATDDPDVITLDKYTGTDTLPCTGPLTPLGLVPERHDGVVIAYINQDPQTYGVRGTDLHRDLDNLHSMGMVAGSCSISNTFLQLTMIRKGSIFQIIDPWLTSWYVQLGSEIFYRDVAYGGVTVGEAYDAALSKVGPKYVTEEWWWDHWENIIYFGDPDLRIYTPNDPFMRPIPVTANKVVEGHAVMAARDHPAALSGSTGWAMVQWVGVILLVAEATRFALKRGYLRPLTKRVATKTKASA
jgi:hypothetical protein